MHKNNVCRLCAQEKSDLEEVFSPENTVALIAELVEKYLTFKISLDDIYPKQICLGCKSIVINFHSFACNCKDAELYIQSLFDESKTNSKYDIKLEICVPEETKDYRFSDDGNFKNEHHEEFAECFDYKVLTDNDANDKKPLTLRKAKYKVIDNETDISECLSMKLIPFYIKNKKELPYFRKKKHKRKNKIKHSSEAVMVSEETLCVKIGSKRLKCKECDERFLGKAMRTKHMRIFHEKTYTCNDCGKTFNSKWKIQQHIISHIEVKEFQCDQCEKSYRTKYLLKAHVHLHSNEKYPCPKCPAVFNSSIKLRSHLSVHNEGRIPCPRCSQTFKSKTTLTVHMSRQHEGYEKGSNRIKAVLLNLEESEVAESKHVCCFCAKKFKDIAHLRFHEQTHVEHEDPRQWPCPICPKMLSSKANVRYHILNLHDKLKSHICEHCGKSFVNLFLLRKHMISHIEKREFPCDRCDLKFKTEAHLRLHGHTHTEQRFKCPKCPKVFNTPRTLCGHSRLHKNTQYSCPVCNKLFRTRTYVTRHMSTHESERPYPCHWCSLNYSSKQALKSHHKKNHPELEFIVLGDKKSY